MTEINEKIVDKEKGLESKYVILEKDKRQYMKITNWRTVEEERTFEGKTKQQICFKCDVISTSQSRNALVFQDPIKFWSCSSIKARKKLNELLDKHMTNEIVFISVKKTGEGSNTTYDIELEQ